MQGHVAHGKMIQEHEGNSNAHNCKSLSIILIHFVRPYPSFDSLSISEESRHPRQRKAFAIDPITETYYSQPATDGLHEPRTGRDRHRGGSASDAPPPLLEMMAAELRRCRAEAAELRLLLADTEQEAALLREQLLRQQASRRRFCAARRTPPPSRRG
jgi:hypothetical protein